MPEPAVSHPVSSFTSMPSPQLIVGSERRTAVKSRAIAPAGLLDRRRPIYTWAGTVHAVDATDTISEHRAACGAAVRFVFPDSLWPPGIAAHTCPECTRLTH